MSKLHAIRVPILEKWSLNVGPLKLLADVLGHAMHITELFILR